MVLTIGMLNSADGVWVANGYLIASVADRLTVLSSGSVASTNADIASSSFNQVDSWVSVVGSPVGIFLDFVAESCCFYMNVRIFVNLVIPALYSSF